jgi:hypothetical protein
MSRASATTERSVIETAPNWGRETGEIWLPI